MVLLICANNMHEFKETPRADSRKDVYRYACIETGINRS